MRNQMFRDAGSVLSVGDLLTRGSFFPTRMFKTHKFSENITLTAPNTNLAVEQVWLLNGLHTIDFTNSVGNPWEWAVASAIWAQYVVLRARFVIIVSDPTADGLCCGVQLRGPTVSGATNLVCCTRPGNKAQILSSTGEQRVAFRGDINLPLAFGRSLEVYRSNYGANVGANPGGATPADYSCMLRFFGISSAGGASTTFNTKVEIEFDTEMFDLQY